MAGSFLCWRDIRLAIVTGIGISLGLSLLYIVVSINLWTVSSYYVSVVEGGNCMPGSKCSISNVDGSVNVIAIGVIMETLNVIVSTVALYGVAQDRRSIYVGWMIFLPIYIVYEGVTVILMIVNLSSLVSNSNSLPALFTVFNLWGSGASSLTVQVDSVESTGSPVAQLSQTDIDSINLPFITVIIFWFIQIIINIISEAALVKQYRGDNYLRDPRPFDIRGAPPSRSEVMYPYAYPNSVPMGYANPAVAYSNNMMARPYVAAYPAPSVTKPRQY